MLYNINILYTLVGDYMFTYVRLKNYKSLVDFEANLISKGDKLKNLILIYGENGVGKSNFISSFLTLQETFKTRFSTKLFDDFNVVSLELDDAKREVLNRINKISTVLKQSPEETILMYGASSIFEGIESVIKKYKTIDSKENMIMQFEFKIQNKKGKYYLETDNNKIVSEYLEFIHNKDYVEFFNITEENIKINSNVFKDDSYRKDLKNLCEKYWGKHSLMSILLYDIKDKNENYVKKRTSTNLVNLINYLYNIPIKIEDDFIKGNTIISQEHFKFDFIRGSIDIEEEAKLETYQNILDNIFTSLYADVKEVYYKKSNQGNKIEYELYFKKILNNEIVDIDFSFESNGTKKILNLIYYLLYSLKNSIVIIDEFDNGIHDLLVTHILDNISEYIKGQIIITTHNTHILESNELSKNAYVLMSDASGNKQILPISSFERLHPNLNIRDRYLNGLYYGVPLANDIDFDSIQNML